MPWSCWAKSKSPVSDAKDGDTDCREAGWDFFEAALAFLEADLDVWAKLCEIKNRPFDAQRLEGSDKLS